MPVHGPASEPVPNRRMCIEDVNHEVYGGIYSQMIFGESFQEPPHTEPAKGFWSPDGPWQVRDGEVHGDAGPGPKLISRVAPFANGEAGVEVHLGGEGARASGVRNAGLIVAVSRAEAGADNFTRLRDLDRRRPQAADHRPAPTVTSTCCARSECEVPTDRWVGLSVRFTAGGTIEAFVDGKSVAKVDDPRPLPPGTIGLRQWQRPAGSRKLWVKSGDGPRTDLPFESDSFIGSGGQWDVVAGRHGERGAGGGGRGGSSVRRGSEPARHVRARRRRGRHRQRRPEPRGDECRPGQAVRGICLAATDEAREVFASLESRDGTRTYARDSAEGRRRRRVAAVRLHADAGRSRPRGTFRACV